MSNVACLLEVDDLGSAGLTQVLRTACGSSPLKVLQDSGVALLFQKPSSRTRHSMEMAVVQLGGHPVSVIGAEVGIDERESAEDVARNLACYHAAIGVRVFDHTVVERMAAVSPVPVVNMLSDQAHPLQALADLLTIQQAFGQIAGCRIAYVGDPNNVSRSLAIAAVLAGGEFVVASPSDYCFNTNDLQRIAQSGAVPVVMEDPFEAVQGAQVVYTDVWVSMGQEADAVQKLAAFSNYMVTPELMAEAAPEAIFMHCLPARPGSEVNDEVLYGPQSRIWQQAENRMHTARGALSYLLKTP
ncbi:MAG: ornithine carbamoyltransferase [Acidimicrobiia bacterium]|nr:ornithine carbamoyltransferase [Acidimicrobiia bacterium]MYC57470.1 ornithine carbamoyltransferase [Acidimicrobiia bacterium]MYI30042.1 ornithine carbamoyltransferase [Acidimicrobiia bacterium]